MIAIKPVNTVRNFAPGIIGIFRATLTSSEGRRGGFNTGEFPDKLFVSREKYRAKEREMFT